MKLSIPYQLLLFRLLLGPIIIFLSCQNNIPNKKAILVLVIFLGLLSDVFDGIIARKQGISSEKLRRADSQIDLIFWLCVAFCVWILHPQFVETHKWNIIIIFSMEALTYVFSFLKFKKETCTHAILSKLWGISLLTFFVSIIGFENGFWTLKIMTFIGVIAHLDVYLIIYFLPKWTHDVPSCYHAYLLKKGKTIKRNALFNG
jgi:CDP-diacylglycerol---glycerol-3-phosphate 3-phosphatidyltransferase